MASIMTKRGSQDNVVTYEHICDSVSDMASIEDKYATLGSTCIVLKGGSGGMEVYIADSDHQWQSLAIAGGSSSGGSTIVVDNSSLFHVCTSSEVRANGTPKITSPEENIIYLVPTDGETNNLFNEYLYVNSKWEMIGSAGIDLSEYVTYQDLDSADYAPKESPIFTGSISLGRKDSTVVGINSIALGSNTTASGPGASAQGNGTTASSAGDHAEGGSTVASGGNAHAEGGGTTASGYASHSEGGGTMASGDNAHSEGAGTAASGRFSHSEGSGTRAIGDGAHSEGGGTVASGGSAHAEGGGTGAHRICAHAEGGSTLACGSNSHAEGGGAKAYGDNSHAEGGGALAAGNCSHAEGDNTTAIGYAEHTSGQFNVLDTAPTWISGTSYTVGDLISIEETFTDTSNTQRTRTAIYKCKTANSDTSFTSYKWTPSGQYLFVIGNGVDNNNRSNAFAVDLEGKGYFNSDLYANCNSDGTGGEKVATEAYVNARIPTPPTTNGTYTLQVTVTNGTPTYSWTSLSSLSGVTF